MTDKRLLFGVPTEIAFRRISNVVSSVVWRSNLRRHISDLITEDETRLGLRRHVYDGTPVED